MKRPEDLFHKANGHMKTEPAQLKYDTIYMVLLRNNDTLTFHF